MHITILAVGSLGDVLPFVALGVRLKNEGHQVRIGAAKPFGSLVLKHRLEFAEIEGNPRDLMGSGRDRLWLDSGKNPVTFYRGLTRLFEQILTQSLASSVAACRDTHGIVYSPLGAMGYHLGEMMGVPHLFALLQPFSRTREFACIQMPKLPFGGLYNRLTYLAAEQLGWQTARALINRWRKDSLGLKPLGPLGTFSSMYRERSPWLYGFSHHVVPRPADWPAEHQLSGFWHLDESEAWDAPPELEAFLSEGPAPLYAGMGSMFGKTAEEVMDTATEAARLAGKRIVLAGIENGGVPGPVSDDVYRCGYVPHDWLFPRMGGVLHHGGAGTTAAGLRAGVPTITIPLFGDQPFWASRVARLGAGPPPLQARKLTPQTLARVISETVHSEKMRARAGALGRRLRHEQGVAKAAALVSEHLAG